MKSTSQSQTQQKTLTLRLRNLKDYRNKIRSEGIDIAALASTRIAFGDRGDIIAYESSFGIGAAVMIIEHRVDKYVKEFIKYLENEAGFEGVTSVIMDAFKIKVNTNYSRGAFVLTRMPMDFSIYEKTLEKIRDAVNELAFTTLSKDDACKILVGRAASSFLPEEKQ